MNSETEWNSVTINEEQRPRVSPEDLREMLNDLDPDDFDEDVQNFLAELEQCTTPEQVDELKPAATLLLQDEVGLSPDLAAMGVEPDEALIRLLLSAGADPDATNPHGQTPLHLAAFYGYENVVDMLVAAGADLRRKNASGLYAANVAATHGIADKIRPTISGNEDLPPEIEDADYIPPDYECTCGCHEHGDHEHNCHCHENGNCDCHEHKE